MTDETGDEVYCEEGARPSLALENERDGRVTATLELGEVDGTYELDPGDRVVESGAFEARSDLQGALQVDGHEWHLAWPERSCYRHGIAVVPDGVEIGRVEPIHGPGDAQHDCYSGTDIALEVSGTGEQRTVEITVDDTCTDETTERTVTVAADDHERLDVDLVSGTAYEVAVDVEDGASATEDFPDICWGISAHIDEDGEIRVEQIPID